MAETFDVVIAGGGPVGAALALALRTTQLRVALVEARAPGAAETDGRAIALAYGSRLILERLGVWEALVPAATPIIDIHVSQQGGYGRAHLSAAASCVPALGYVVPYYVLANTLRAALSDTPVELMSGRAVHAVEREAAQATLTLQGAATREAVCARLAVIADGGAELNLAPVKRRDYGQSALVFDVVSEQSHHNRAFERFTEGGPLALLPTARGWSVVWTLPPAQAQQLAALDDQQFCQRLRDAFGGTLGAFSAPSRRLVFALALKYAPQPMALRTVLIGNAAQTLHPVAGQGFNLGLRDAWELAHALIACRGPDVGTAAVLQAYLSRRRFDRIATILFTDSLIRLFRKDIPLLAHARSLGLAAFGALPLAKSFLSRRMLFGING